MRHEIFFYIPTKCLLEYIVYHYIKKDDDFDGCPGARVPRMRNIIGCWQE